MHEKRHRVRTLEPYVCSSTSVLAMVWRRCQVARRNLFVSANRFGIINQVFRKGLFMFISIFVEIFRLLSTHSFVDSFIVGLILSDRLISSIDNQVDTL